MQFDEKMDGSQGVGAVGANSSSDFVSRRPPSSLRRLQCSSWLRSENFTSRNARPLCRDVSKRLSKELADGCPRMLEDPTYSSVVRWGDEGDSFVVLEVGTNGN